MTDDFDLGRLQRWMQSVISHPGGVPEGIESGSARSELEVPLEGIESVIAPSSKQSSVERLGIYSSAYFARLIECLREVFPTLAHALGVETFDGFAVGYLRAYPPQSYTLDQLGAGFAQFLEETRPDRDRKPGEVGWPDLLIDLARLDWTIGRVFDGPGVEHLQTLAPDALADIQADAWPSVRLETAPCLRLLAFEYEVNDYFSAIRRGENPSPPRTKPTWLALSRRNYVVHRFPLSRVQYELLAALSEGLRVGAAIERAVQNASMPIDELASDLQQWFREWTAASFFIAVR